MSDINQTQLINSMVKHYDKTDILFTELIRVSQQCMEGIEKNGYVSLHQLVTHRHVLIEQIASHEAVIRHNEHCLQKYNNDFRVFNHYNMEYMFLPSDLEQIITRATSILDKVNYLLYRDKIDMLVLRKYRINLRWQRKCLLQSRKRVNIFLHKPFFI